MAVIVPKNIVWCLVNLILFENAVGILLLASCFTRPKLMEASSISYLLEAM